ncbi:MAG: helix-turn-helix transcriptional regulator [Acidibacillus sp.]|nr:helix-turn-helix transcriptional regulator [Acidibacillus sp.]
MPRRTAWPEHPHLVGRYELGRRLKEARERNGLSLTDVQRAIEVNRGAITSYETMRTVPPLQYLIELCALYGITPSAILDPEPLHGDEDELILSALHAQPGLRDLVLQMVRNRSVFEQVREWMGIVEILQKEKDAM